MKHAWETPPDGSLLPLVLPLLGEKILKLLAKSVRQVSDLAFHLIASS
jgi:hypothetical protein